MEELFHKANVSMGKKIGSILLILLSVSALHYTGFVLGIPKNLRPLLDLNFRMNFVSGMLFIGTFSMIVARYLPSLILAIMAMIVEQTIHLKYTARGYRRAKLNTAVFWDGRFFDNDARKEFERSLKFGRNEARIYNLTSRKIHSLLPVLWYEKYRIPITVVVTTFVFLFYYLGLKYSFLLSSFGFFIFGAFSVYRSFDDGFKFRLFGTTFLGDSQREDETKFSFDLDDLLFATITIAILAPISGHLRLKEIIKGEEVIIVQGDMSSEGVLVGVTSNGVLIFNDRFQFKSFDAINISN